MKDLNLEVAKIQATLDNLIYCVRNNAEVDVLGSLYVLKDQMNTLDAAIDEKA